MINISISLSNGDISLIIILCGGFIYFLNYLYLYLKKKYNGTMDTVHSINYTLQNLNYSLNDYIYANRKNILKIRKNSEDVNNVMRIVSTLYTLKCYYDVIKPIIKPNEISNILSNCFGNIFDRYNNTLCQHTDFTGSYFGNDPKNNLSDKKNDNNIKKKKTFEDFECNIKKNDNDNTKKEKISEDVTHKKNKSDEFNNVMNKIINNEYINDDNTDNTNNNKSDEIEKNISNHLNLNKKNIYNSTIEAHPKLYLSNGLITNEKENIQNKFNEYIYNTDKLKNDILNNNINIFKKTDVHFDTNKNNENNNIKFNNTDVVGINDGNMSYAPFN